MKFEQVAEAAMELTSEERDKLRSMLWNKKEEEAPKITAARGQIVKWKSGFPSEPRIGFADRNYKNVAHITVIEYMQKFDCYAQARVDSDSEGLEITDVFMDMSRIEGGEANAGHADQ